MYRGYYGGGYNDPEDLMKIYGQQPGYSPYSKNFQPGMAIQNVLMQLAMLKQMKEGKRKEEEREKWERGIKERQVAAEELRSIPEPPKPSAEEEKRRNRSGYTRIKVDRGDWTEEQGERYVETGQEPTPPKTLSPNVTAWALKFYGYTPDQLRDLTPEEITGITNEFEVNKRPSKARPPKPIDRGAKIREYKTKESTVNVKYDEKIANLKSDEEKDSRKAWLDYQKDQNQTISKEVHQLNQQRISQEYQEKRMALEKARKMELESLRSNYEEWLPKNPAKSAMPPPPPGAVLDKK